MENIYEKCIVREKTAVDNLITLAAVLAALGTIAAFFIWEPLRMYSVAAGIVVVLIAWRVINDRNIEYEYILAGNSFALDKIMNKRRRKRIINCDLTDFDLIAPIGSNWFLEHSDNYSRKIVTVSGDHPEDEFFGILEYKGKRTMVVFETDERARNHLKKHLENTYKS